MNPRGLYEATLKNWWDKERGLDETEQSLWRIFSGFMAGAIVFTVIAFFATLYFIIPALACCVAASYFNEQARRANLKKLDLAAKTRADIAYIETEDDK